MLRVVDGAASDRLVERGAFLVGCRAEAAAALDDADDLFGGRFRWRELHWRP